MEDTDFTEHEKYLIYDAVKQRRFDSDKYSELYGKVEERYNEN